MGAPTAHVVLGGGSTVAGLAAAGVLVGAVAAAWSVTRSGLLTLAAAATATAWAPLYHAPPRVLAVALVPAIVLAVPQAARVGTRARQGLAGLAVAALVAAAAGLDPLEGSLVSALSGLVAAGPGPQPTDEGLHVLRSGALHAPPAAFAGLVVLEAVTDRWAGLPSFEALLLGVGVAGVLTLGSLAVLGAGVLLGSRHPARGTAWPTLVGTGLAPFPLLVGGDLPAVLAGLAAATAPLALLPVVALARWGAARRPWGWSLLVLGPVAAALPWLIV